MTKTVFQKIQVIIRQFGLPELVIVIYLKFVICDLCI